MCPVKILFHVTHNYHEEEELSYARLALHHPLKPSSHIEMFVES